MRSDVGTASFVHLLELWCREWSAGEVAFCGGVREPGERKVTHWWGGDT